MLIGRASERQLIDRLLAGARLGESGVLLVTGEPGVGKTALLEDAASGTDGMQLLRATGSETERDIAFGGLLHLLRPALGLLDDIPPPQAEALAAALALRPGTPGDRFAIGAATLSLICRYAERAPVAILVDDLQLVDEPSAEALMFAARRLMADPIALILAVRADDLSEAAVGVPRLRLGGLDLPSSRDLLESSSAGVTEDQLGRLHQATAGNPLALLELAADPETWEQSSPAAPLPVPATVAGAFARRMRSLDDDTRAALLVAAATGGDVRTTAATCERLGIDPAALTTAQTAGLVDLRHGPVRFRHPLLRSAVYASANVDQRRATHAAVADALADEDPDRHAWHLSEATWTPSSAVADLLDATAVRAADRRAYAVAATAYERAARLTPEHRTWVARMMSAAEAAWFAGAGRRALSILDEIDDVAEAVPSHTRVRALELRAAISARTGSLHESRKLVERAAEELDDPDDTVVLLADAIHASFYLGDAPSLLALAERTESAMTTVTDPRARALGLMATGMARIVVGRGGADQIRAALPLLTSSEELRAEHGRLPWLMLAPLFLRDADTGDELRQAVREARNRAGVGALPALLFHVARDEATTDRWARAEANYTEAIRLARETGQTTELATSLAGLAWLESRQGKEIGCRAHADEALTLCQPRHIHLGEAWVLFALGDLELGLGNPAAAVEQFDKLTGLLDTLGVSDPDLSPQPELVDALIRLRREAEARTAAHRYLNTANAKGQPWACARAERAVGLLAPDDEIDHHFRAALQIHERTLDRFEVGRTLLGYGSRLRRARRRVDARPQLREALAVFDELGASRWSDQAAAELEATGETVRRRGPADIAALTPQELQVSLLLAEGRTTREAAAALFLSPKTVDYHLRKVYTKLGIRSRAELADLLPH